MGGGVRPVVTAVAGLVVVGLGAVLAVTAPRGAVLGWTVWAFVVGGGLLLSAACHLWAVRYGVAAVWAELVAALGLRDDERVLDLRSGPARVPAEPGRFDVVLATLAPSDLPSRSARHAVVAGTARLLRPGGRLVLVDLGHAGEDAEVLRAHGVDDVRVTGLGPRLWFGGPWAAGRLVTGRKRDSSGSSDVTGP